MKSFIRNISLLVACSLLAGCGGGGTDGGAAMGSVSAYFKLYEADAISSSRVQTTGSKSTNTASLTNAGYGRATVSLSQSDFSYNSCYNAITPCLSLNMPTWCQRERNCTYYPAETIKYQMYSSLHITDTGAEEAWASGWTGLGQTIAVIDDFSNEEIDLRITVNDSYYLRQRHTHGQVVANIAGGDGATPLVSTEVSYQYYNHYPESVTTSVRRSAGVAKDAMVVTNHVSISSNASAESSINSIVSHLENSSSMAAVNLSLGFMINTVGVTYSELMAEAENAVQIPTTDAVITVAAGNSGAACTNQNLNGCNALGIVLAAHPNTNKNTILVGATAGSGNSEELATYSSRGGMFSDRFLLASGDTGLKNWNGGYVDGTSFAAPRVAGAAAILRQKFPNLSGSDAASILLLTASKDLNGDGVNDFSGVSATFGHGKLDLASALSPVGTLAIK